MRYALVLLLAGCDQLFGFVPVVTVDASHASDAPASPPLTDGPAAITPDAQLDAAPSSCPAGYIPLGSHGSMYRLSTMTADFGTARGACDMDGAGITRHTHLVVLDDDSERITIFSKFGGSLWIGLVRIGLDNAFQPITDQQTNYPPQAVPPWASGEPSGKVGEDCVQTISTGSLDDQQCGALRPYVCECDDFKDDSLH